MRQNWSRAADGEEFGDHRLYLTVTAQGSLRVVPVRQANGEGEQNEWDRTKEIGLVKGFTEWVRIFSDMKNACYKVFPSPADVVRGEPQWPDLKEAKIFRLAFRDKGRLIDSTQHPLFLQWVGRANKD